MVFPLQNVLPLEGRHPGDGGRRLPAQDGGCAHEDMAGQGETGVGVCLPKTVDARMRTWLGKVSSM